MMGHLANGINAAILNFIEAGDMEKEGCERFKTFFEKIDNSPKTAPQD